MIIYLCSCGFHCLYGQLDGCTVGLLPKRDGLS